MIKKFLFVITLISIAIVIGIAGCLFFVKQESALAQVVNTYWVSPTGVATWANCKSDTQLSGAAACSYSTANTNAVAGDIVYYRSGTYDNITGSAINPKNTGTAGNIITFSAYNGENVVFNGSGLSSFAVNLDSEFGTVRSYIKVQGMTFNNFMKHLWIRKGTHNEISHCSFIGFPAGAILGDFNGVWSASYIYRQAIYNWIHDSTFGRWGACEPFGTDVGVVFQVGLETSTTDLTKYNLIENNEMYSGGHHVVSFNGSYNVYRNNYFHNEPWCPIGSPIYSTRITFQTGADGDGKYNLVEGNRIGYGGPKNKTEIGGAGGTLAGAYNIWRKNLFLQIYTDAQLVTKYSGQTDVKYNHIYNNTYWHGGYGAYQKWPNGTVPSTYWNDAYTHPIVVTDGGGTGVYGNIFKNNIFYDNQDLYSMAYSIINISTHITPIYQTLSNNWFDNAGDPKFADISGTPDPTNSTQFDFHLQSNSPAIDNGGFLTAITSVDGSGLSFAVDDASYFFYPYSNMDSEISGSNIVGDSIQLEGQGSTYTITSIDYNTNIITIDSPMTWTKGQGVSLAYKGTAPDIGAYEYIQASPPLKGDFNSDSKVNDLDFASFKNAFKSIFNSIFDLNSDSTIDVKDLGVLMSGWLE